MLLLPPLYMLQVMKDTLVYLTHLDPVDTENIMLDRLAKQVSVERCTCWLMELEEWPFNGALHTAFIRSPLLVLPLSASSLLQVDIPASGQLNWDALNTLCWAIGSISGTMSEADEKRFLVTVIKDLLGMCEVSFACGHGFSVCLIESPLKGLRALAR